jgi:hypothetical protein
MQGSAFFPFSLFEELDETVATLTDSQPKHGLRVQAN